ncbi:MAG: 50S ribosomal protein L32e [Candidatus Thermoplasmatota archaeon]|nr:50S ribosomal protein L32e [Candidatus Thermoplasmatota archaeon]
MAPRKKVEDKAVEAAAPLAEKARTEKKSQVPDQIKKIKPKLDAETLKLLQMRAERLSKQPKFLRNEWFRYERLENVWRRPRGQTNKLRLNYRYRSAKVRIGYGKPAAVRGMHPSGFREVSVHRSEDLEGVDPKTQAVRIGSTVGTRKRRQIVEVADKLGIRVLNRGVL